MSDRTPALHLNITFSSGARIGPGKATLLEGIRDTGSISGAARAMGMDYKRAWLLLDTLDRAFDTPVVERKTGGPGGGGAALTDLRRGVAGAVPAHRGRSPGARRA